MPLVFSYKSQDFLPSRSLGDIKFDNAQDKSRLESSPYLRRRLPSTALSPPPLAERDWLPDLSGRRWRLVWTNISLILDSSKKEASTFVEGHRNLTTAFNSFPQQSSLARGMAFTSDMLFTFGSLELRFAMFPPDEHNAGNSRLVY